MFNQFYDRNPENCAYDQIRSIYDGIYPDRTPTQKETQQFTDVSQLVGITPPTHRNGVSYLNKDNDLEEYTLLRSTFLRIATIPEYVWNMRLPQNPDTVADLKASLQQYGMLDPIRVIQSDDYYIIVGGMTRLDLVIKGQAPDIVKIKVLDEDVCTRKAIEEFMIMDDLHRRSINPIDAKLRRQQLYDLKALPQGYHRKKASVVTETDVTNNAELKKEIANEAGISVGIVNEDITFGRGVTRINSLVEKQPELAKLNIVDAVKAGSISVKKVNKISAKSKSDSEVVSCLKEELDKIYTIEFNAEKSVNTKKDELSEESKEILARLEAEQIVIANTTTHCDLLEYATSNDFAIDLTKSRVFKNPYSLNKEGSTESILAKYFVHASISDEIQGKLESLKGKILFSANYPVPCHGAVLKAMVLGELKADTKSLDAGFEFTSKLA